MEAPNNIILPALILIPFIAGFICWLVDKLDQHLPRYIALIGSRQTGSLREYASSMGLGVVVLLMILIVIQVVGK